MKNTSIRETIRLLIKGSRRLLWNSCPKMSGEELFGVSTLSASLSPDSSINRFWNYCNDPEADGLKASQDGDRYGEFRPKEFSRTRNSKSTSWRRRHIQESMESSRSYGPQVWQFVSLAIQTPFSMECRVFNLPEQQFLAYVTNARNSGQNSVSTATVSITKLSFHGNHKERRWKRWSW
ncbi:PREDICTED: uncharacterized protein LOC106298726 [Brassica oleracea var. oleracea]|uniref:Uncharacterized protein n=2 Tax=Brassica oleracea TaxID=3712 RepID=A0A0D3CTR0_BRAOL|nr:PREDICTED: uncharacterized protein LOC106298726 [Brassica oleracea var. oleracea]VDD61918.1 unnamed protein product [Brassica oleracea]